MRISDKRPETPGPGEVRLYHSEHGRVAFATPHTPRLDVSIDAPDLVARIRAVAELYQHTPRRLVLEVLDKVIAPGPADLVGAVLGER
jgi:hypothetical protein